MNTETPKLFSPWPYAIIGVFILLAIGNAVLLFLALESRSQLVDTRPYEQGLAYEKILSQKTAAQRDGVRFSLTITERVSVRVENLDTSKQWSIRVRLIRPDDSRLDRELTGLGHGPLFELDASLKPGLWLAQITLESPEKSYFYETKSVL